MTSDEARFLMLLGKRGVDRQFDGNMHNQLAPAG